MTDQMKPAQPPQAAAPATNTMALVSLIAGIVGLNLVPRLPSGAAVITGPMVRKQIAGMERSDGLAKAGMILGWSGTLFGLCVSLGIVIALMSAIRDPGMTPADFYQDRLARRAEFAAGGQPRGCRPARSGARLRKQMEERTP